MIRSRPWTHGSRLWLPTLAGSLALLLGCAANDGRWVSGGDLEVVGIHTALMPNGLVLAFGYSDANHFVDQEGRHQLWDPVARAAAGPSVMIAGWNPFCAGHAFLGDGRLFVAGGFKFGNPLEPSSADKVGVVAVGPTDGSITWTSDIDRMEDVRWYPTVITLANGDGLILGGSAPFAADNWKDTNEDVEYFSVANDYLVRHNETQRSYPQDGGFDYPDGDPRQQVSDGERLAGLYPLAHVLPAAADGDAPNGVLFVLTESFARLYNPTTNRILAPKIDVGGFRTWWTQGSSVLLPIDVDPDGRGPDEVRVLVVGGGTLGRADRSAPALGEAEIWRYSVSDRSLALEDAIPLRRNRFMGDAVLLPDGNVVVVGGAEIGYANENSRRVRYAELIRPPTPGAPGETVGLAEASELRGYHASAVLLPDGAVFVTGGTGGWDNAPVQEFKSVEVFEPPYLFLGERPRVISAPFRVVRGDQFTVVVGAAPEAVEPTVVLIRNGSRTHSLDTDQRMLRFQARAVAVDNRTELTVVLPTNPTYAPPGPYRLFVLGRARDPGSSPQRLIPSLSRPVMLVHEQARPATPVSQVRLTIETGGDNLEGGDDNAFATLLDRDDAVVVAEFPLNGGAEWGNHTIHSVTQALSPTVSLDQLRKLRVRTTFGGGLSGDNWNIDRLIVDYHDGVTWRTLHDDSGFPLARLTGDRPTWTALLATR